MWTPISPQEAKAETFSQSSRGSHEGGSEEAKASWSYLKSVLPGWLSNIVGMKKRNGKWRVCVNFTNLNRAWPKDLFTIPKIDQFVDTTYGHLRMSFLDAFQRYDQIALAPENQEKTSFISPKGNYHYTVMPFGLKNAETTYQQMVSRMFRQ